MSEGSEGLELPVWLGGCEKWVTGLTKRTTCDDVIYALVKHSGNPNDEDVDISCFCIFERWRDVERPLSGRTKIMKVWRAWGDECSNVRFSVRKVDLPLDTSSEISRSRRSRKHISARERRSREKTRSRPMTNGPGIRHKDYGLIDGNGFINDRCKAQAFHELVQVVIEQEKKIQEQFSRIRETDTQIENYETKMHELRMRENGENYVQEAYLRERGGEDSSSGGEELFPAIKAKDLEAYMHICENILHLEDRISGEQSNILDISHQIQEESVLEAPPTPPRLPLPPPPVECREGAGGGPLTPVQEDVMQEEVERLRSELQRSACLTHAQQHQLQLVEMTMGELEAQISQKGDFINRMLYEFNIAEHASVAPPPSLPATSAGLYPGDFPADRHSSSTSGVSEVSELEGSDRSTSRSRRDRAGGGSNSNGRSSSPDGRRPDETRSRDSSRDRGRNAARGRYGSMPALNDLGGARADDRPSRVTFCNTTITRERGGALAGQGHGQGHGQGYGQGQGQPPLPLHASQRLLQRLREEAGESGVYSADCGRQPTPSGGEEYYVTRAYYPPPASYRDTYLNQPTTTKTLSDDSNSDTGLSSLHSDEAPPILETLV